jgi:1-acyl-sn-glycerol-3-phosphate acyltransferase
VVATVGAPWLTRDSWYTVADAARVVPLRSVPTADAAETSTKTIAAAEDTTDDRAGDTAGDRAGDSADEAAGSAAAIAAAGDVVAAAVGDLAAGLTTGLEFLRRRLSGDYPVDDFGFDRDLTESVLLPALRPLYQRWFRTEVTGASNIPDDGGALLVGNHAGGLWALDAVMVAVAVHDESTQSRFLRLLGADLVFSTPVVGTLARKSGSTLACNPDAERLLDAGELVGVFPEGFKGIGKPFADRYKLQRFGRGGFVTAALKSGVPIIPVSIVGSEEIHPMIGNAKLLARLFNLPYFPLTPTFPWLGPLGLVPLPSKWHIEFGEPIETSAHGADAAEDPMLVFELTDRVRETIQSTLYRLLARRTSTWR